jgi:hypothetical protein
MNAFRSALCLTAIASLGSARAATAPDSAAVTSTAPYTLPAERVTRWQPGVPRGVLRYSAVHSTITAAAFDQGKRDARAAIQAALDAAGRTAGLDGIGRVVSLSAGTFSVSGPVSIPSHVVLRGAGPDATRLVATGNEHPVVVIGASLHPHPGVGAVDLSETGQKGAESIQVANASGFAVGQFVYLDETTDNQRSQWNPSKHPPGAGRNWFCREDRPIAQVLEIAAIDGPRISFRTPLHIEFRKTQAAQLSRFDVPAVTYAGVEDLRVSSGRAGNIQLNHAAYSWVKHVESDDSYGSSVALRQSYRCEIRDSYLHDSYYYNHGGAGYGLDLTFASSDNLIENNISIRFNKVINCRASGGGNVIAYNYTDDGAMNSEPTWVETGLQASHYPTPHFELFEGNYGVNIDGDFTEGNAYAITYFRNQASGLRRNTPRFLHDTGNRRMAAAMRGHLNYNFVGNVLGLPGTSPAPGEKWVYESEFPWANEPFAVWRIGYWDQDRASRDAAVVSSVVRDGNYDYVTNSVHWHNTPNFPGQLPPSLYLKSKPAFFGDEPWPWVDPLGGTKTYTLPAKARYDAGTPNQIAEPPPPTFQDLPSEC